MIVLILIIGVLGCTNHVSDNNAKEGETNIKTPESIDLVNVYLTAQGTSDRLAQKDPVRFEDVNPLRESDVYVDFAKTFQTFEGIGGAFTDASAETFFKMPPDKQEKVLTDYFDSENGIGYTFVRTHINSTDFSLGSYVYVDDPADTALTTFSVDHDKQYRIPFIKKALEKSGGNIKIIASPWSPPAYMKSNNEMSHGGKLLSKYYGTWARYYVKFIEAYEKEGVPIWGLTVQNEPLASPIWESCIYTAEEERDFVKNYLGPELEKSGLFPRIKLMVWDHNRSIMYQRAKVVYDDPEASKYVWGTGFHWYVTDSYENVRMLHDAYPDKAIVFTEGCVYPYDGNRLNEWHWGEKYAEAMIHDFNNYTCAWSDWNILLDETGGPNHVENFCYAPIICDTQKGELHYMNSYYYIGHFSKFIRPGAKRVVCTTSRDDILATAFLNTDGKVAVIVMNSSDKDIEISIGIERKVAGILLPAHSIMTGIID